MNIKLSLFCTSFLLFLSSENALTQSLVFDWVAAHNGTLNESSEAIELGANGDIYNVGHFNDTLDLDPSPAVFNIVSPAEYDQDIFIQKLDNNGNFLWGKSIGGFGYDGAPCIAVDSVDNLYLIGYFYDTIDVDPSNSVYNIITPGQIGHFMLKLDPNGNFLSASKIEYSDYLRINEILISESGFLYLIGTFKGLADFDLGPTIDTLNPVDHKLFVAKYTLNNDLVWVNTYFTAGSSSYDVATIGANETIYVVGNQTIKKIDSSGVLLWEINEPTNVLWTDIATDTANNIYLCGNYSAWGNTDIDPTSTVLYVYNIASIPNGAVVKLSDLGQFQWGYSFGDGGTDNYSAVTVSDDGTVFLTGKYQGSPDFNPGAAVNQIQPGNAGTFVQCLSLSGGFLSARVITSSGGGKGTDLELDEFGNVYLSGYFSGMVDFDPSLNNVSYPYTPYNKMFVEKFNSCTPTQSTETISGCDSYDWINGLNYTTDNYIDTFIMLAGSSNGCDSIVHLNLEMNQSSGSVDSVTACISYTWMNGTTYAQSTSSPTWLITNSEGCDSIITLHLTINPVDIGISPINDSTLYSTATGATAYQWLHCENGLIPMNGETSQYLYPSMNGNYAVIVTENGCVDTSSCFPIVTIGLIENDFGNTINVRPNPSSGKMIVSFNEEHSTVDLIIRNIEGKLISHSVFNKTNEIEFFIYGNPGFYILELTVNEKKSRTRIMKI